MTQRGKDQNTDKARSGFPWISGHNWIFVGIAFGILLGLATWSIDHDDRITLKTGTELRGSLRSAGKDWVITLRGGELEGEERRVSASEVAETTGPQGRTPHLQWARDSASGRLYFELLWWYDLLGKVIFMGILKMLIAPLILASIVAGVVSLEGLDQLRRIGLKTMIYYIITTAIAVIIGLIAVLTIRPGHAAASRAIRAQRESELRAFADRYRESTGQSVGEPPTTDFKLWLADQESHRMGEGAEAARFKKLLKAKDTGPGDLLKNSLVEPMLMNPFQSLSERNSLGIIVFALLLGVAVVIVGSEARPLADFFSALNAVIIRITTWLMSVAPVFIMFIVAELIGANGPNVFGSVAWYCITVILGIAIHVALLFAIAQVFAHCSPARLWAGIREAWLVAFTTRSSAATLPVTMRCVTQNLGVSPRVANFGLPVGATMNMDGTALYEGVAVIFLIQIYQGLADVPVELGGAATFLIFITAVLASIGAAAVPDAGLVTMVLVANAVGLPVYYIPLIFAVDAFLDMFRTSTNVLGDVVGALVVQRLEDLHAPSS